MASLDFGDAKMDVDQQTAPYAEDVPVPELPMSYPYEETQFYVRKCYPEYYLLIVDLLHGTSTSIKMKWITVTGTPGIGKSIFYLYVFNRIREQGEKTIVTASFNETSRLKKCLVFNPGEDHAIEADIKTTRSMPNTIYLYDGPPDIKPSDCQMICFSSPNYEWLHSMPEAVYACVDS
jgi:hypothetical protein